MFYFILVLGFLSQSAHTEEEHNAFVLWAKQYAQAARQEGGWVCGLQPASRLSLFPWWVSPLQGSDWSRLQHYIHEVQAESVQLRTATLSNISEWPIHSTLEGEGHGKNFSKSVTDAVIQKFSESFLSQNSSFPVAMHDVHHHKHGYFQIWDEYLWLTSSIGSLSQVAPLCWEQREHVHSVWPNNSRLLGWIPYDQCRHTIYLKRTDWFATDLSSRPHVRWAAPNGTQWLCGINLWPWLPPGWIGRCTLGFPWMQGRWVETLDHPGNLSVLQNTTTPDELLSQIGLSFPDLSVGLRDVMLQVESLSHYLDTALNDTGKDISLSNFEDQLMSKADLQSEMVHDILTAVKHGRCEILDGECCVHIPKHPDLEDERPSGTNTVQSIWAFLFKTSAWKWLIGVIGVVLILLLFGRPLFRCFIKFIYYILESSYGHNRFLLRATGVQNIGPLAMVRNPECQEDCAFELISLEDHTETGIDRMGLLSDAC